MLCICMCSGAYRRLITLAHILTDVIVDNWICGNINVVLLGNTVDLTKGSRTLNRRRSHIKKDLLTAVAQWVINGIAGGLAASGTAAFRTVTTTYREDKDVRRAVGQCRDILIDLYLIVLCTS